jgi:hypothetical protein
VAIHVLMSTLCNQEHAQNKMPEHQRQ